MSNVVDYRGQNASCFSQELADVSFSYQQDRLLCKGAFTILDTIDNNRCFNVIDIDQELLPRKNLNTQT